MSLFYVHTKWIYLQRREHVIPSLYCVNHLSVSDRGRTRLLRPPTWTDHEPAGWFSTNTPEFYLKDIPFESCTGHRSHRLFIAFPSPERRMSDRIRPRPYWFPVHGTNTEPSSVPRFSLVNLYNATNKVVCSGISYILLTMIHLVLHNTGEMKTVPSRQSVMGTAKDYKSEKVYSEGTTRNTHAFFHSYCYLVLAFHLLRI